MKPRKIRRIVIRVARCIVGAMFLNFWPEFCLGNGPAPLSISIQFVATRHPSSFAPRLRVHILNQGILAVDLSQLADDSILMVDGKSFNRRTSGFEGPPGLAPLGEWQGCLWLEYYVSNLTPGKHQVVFYFGDVASPPITVDWPAPINWRKGDMATRRAELSDLAESLEKGLPRSCVEEWLTVQDGGVQQPDHVRYYLGPGFKLVVPYTAPKESAPESQVVNGPVKLFQEMRLQD